MSVSAKYRSEVTVSETIATNVPDVLATKAVIVHDQFNKTATIDASSTVPATKTASFQKALSTGAATIDLTALVGSNGAAVDFTGLKVQLAKFRNPSTNANGITVTFGASTPYLLLGAAFKFILLPGQEITIYGNDAAPDVSGSLKMIDLAGTGSQALDVILVAG